VPLCRARRRYTPAAPWTTALHGGRARLAFPRAVDGAQDEVERRAPAELRASRRLPRRPRQRQYVPPLSWFHADLGATLNRRSDSERILQLMDVGGLAIAHVKSHTFKSVSSSLDASVLLSSRNSIASPSDKPWPTLPLPPCHVFSSIKQCATV
jgi:hypothetical protein